MFMKELAGVIVALVTPFTNSGELAIGLLEEHVDYLIAAGVDCLAACGSTGEFEALSFDERIEVYSAVARRAASRVPVMGGVGGRSTREAILMAGAAETSALDAILVLPPHYSGYEFNDEEVFGYFEDIANSTSLTVMLYNNASKSRGGISPRLVPRLAKIPNIRSIKESSADIRRVQDILQATHDGITVISGWDSIVLESLLMGSQGLFSGIANVVPEVLVTLYNLTVQKNYEEALTYYRKVRPLLTFFEDEGRLAAWLKAGMKLRKHDGGYPRKPYLPASDAEIAQIKQALVNAGIDVE
jgi:4-hydroxy-tetrahydrodipicolinate synthase